jgi:hypothetical protein
VWQQWLPAYGAVAAVTLAARLPALAGWATCNPIYRFTGIVAKPIRQILPGQCSVDSGDGMTLQALGGRAAEMWLHGTLPWWNSYAALGLPLAGEGQVPAFFLPFVLLLHFFSGIVVLKVLMQLLAGGCALALFREMKLSRVAAAIGAVLFALNGSFAWFGDSPILPVPFLPALLFALERCRTRAIAGQSGGPLWVALALGYSLLAGFPETAFMDGLLAAVWMLGAAARTPAGRLGAFCGKILCGGLAGLALSTPAWLSFLDYLGISSIGVHSLTVFDRLPASQAASLVMPGAFGPPYADWAIDPWSHAGGYFGTAMVFLVMAGLGTGRRLAGLRWAMAGWVLFWLSVFFGAPVTHAIWLAVPPLNLVQVTRYAMPSMEAAAAVVAALTVDDWRRSRAGLGVLWVLPVFTTLAAVALIPAIRGGRVPVMPSDWCGFLIAAVAQTIMVAGALAWLLAARPERTRVLALAAVIALDAASNFMLPQFAGTRPNRLALAPITYLQAHAGMSRVYSSDAQLPPNYGSWFGIPAIQVIALPFAQVWGDAAAVTGGDVNLIDALGMRLPAAEALQRFDDAVAGLREAGMRFVVVSAQNDTFNTRKRPDLTAVYTDAKTHIYEVSNAAPYMETRGAPCVLTTISRTRAQTDCRGPAVLIRRELLLPGWHARVNNDKVSIGGAGARVDAYVQQVDLPAGPADITWWYTPPHSKLMAWLFACGLAATVIMAVPRSMRAWAPLWLRG